MEEGCASGSGGGGGGESARFSTSYMAAGGRQRFEVELRPGETTIVSWKKLVKDANRAVKDANKAAKGKATAMEVPSVPQSAMESRVAPGEPPENEANDAPPASRFSAVIEKIERLYMGKNSSDEEDLNDVPDDDEYDTEDSFIDDAELDEYFQVDNSAIKHDGFFVNRGTLERTNEPSISPHQQPKKRRRKDLAKGQVGSDEGNAPNKHVKVGKKAAGRSLPLAEKNSTNPTLVMALPTVNFEDLKYQNQTSSSGISAKNNSAKFKSAMHQSPVIVSNGEAITEEKGEKQKSGVLPSKNHGSKLKDGYEFSDTSNHRLNEIISHAQCKSQSARSLNSGEDLGQSVQLREKNGIRERSDITVSEGRNSMQTMKVPHMQRKEGSSVKSRSSMLEKAIRELEKMVAESRPPSMEMLDADISSQAIKRRMPPEIKLKLGKVARLAATHGKISKELLNRLMSIVGHLIQLRTLKRNLKIMVNMGLSAKQETDARFQQIKKEIDEMVKFSVPQLKSKAPEQASGASDDFQENGVEEKEVLKRKFSMDEALEDKICDLYDLYIEGVEEDAGPQARKLYAELAELWPKGFMDNHGIKRAICRAKDRKKLLHSMYKDQEKIKRKKLISKTPETLQGEVNPVVQSQYVQEKLVTDSGATSVNRPVLSITGADTAVRLPTVVASGPNINQPKQEKVKRNFSILNDVKTTEILAKKKVKRKPELELGEAHARPEKLTSVQGEERNKSLKQVAGTSQKADLQTAAAAPNSEKIN